LTHVAAISQVQAFIIDAHELLTVQQANFRP